MFLHRFCKIGVRQLQTAHRSCLSKFQVYVDHALLEKLFTLLVLVTCVLLLVASSVDAVNI